MYLEKHSENISGVSVASHIPTSNSKSDILHMFFVSVFPKTLVMIHDSPHFPGHNCHEGWLGVQTFTPGLIWFNSHPRWHPQLGLVNIPHKFMIQCEAPQL